MSRYVTRRFYFTTSGLTAFLLLILLFISLAVDSEDPFPPGGGDAPDTGDVGSVNDGIAIADSSVAVELANSSFEQGRDAPVGWTPLIESIDGIYLWGTDVVKSGKRSLGIFGTLYNYGRWSSKAINVSWALNPSGGDDALGVQSHAGYSWYSLTGDIKTEENTGEVYLAIAWFDPQGVMITTSDSLMLPLGDNDWQSVTVDALPPEGATTFRVWCISNHNSGFTWFDNLKVQLTQLPAQGKATYEQFLVEYPAHHLAIAAHTMGVLSLMTEAKWIREAGFYDPQEQLRASKLYAEAAGIARNDSVLTQATTGVETDLVEAKEAFESLIDTALWSAAIAASKGDDTDKARQYLSKIVERSRDPDATATAKTWIEDIDAVGKVND